MWHVEPVGYHQTAFNGFALRHLLQHTDADIVMFLDVDEFINVPDRASLVAAFARLTDADRIGELGWRNAVPGRTDTRAISPGEPIWLPSAAGRFGKVVIPRHFYARHGTEARLGIGNHFLYYPPAIRVRCRSRGRDPSPAHTIAYTAPEQGAGGRLLGHGTGAAPPGAMLALVRHSRSHRRRHVSR